MARLAWRRWLQPWSARSSTSCPIVPYIPILPIFRTLPPGGACTVDVTFTPTSVGGARGELKITSSAEGSPDTVALTGTGTDPLKMTPTTLSFGNRRVGDTQNSAVQSVTVSNL